VHKLRSKKRYKFAFTLAEVLITLGIIGVVAALTIPTIIQAQQEIAAASALKKAYSILSQAYAMAVKDNGTPDDWGDTSIKMLDTLGAYLSITKNCGINSGCFPSGYKKLDNNPYTPDIDSAAAIAKAQLADGSLLATSSYGSCTVHNWGSTLALQNPCGDYYVDINGSKGPNKFGYDLFMFYLTMYGIVPAGSQPDIGYRFSSCKTSASGYGCSAWVIYNENMDYLHCSDLAWGVKTKCS